MDPAQELELAAFSRLKSMNDVIGRGDSDIQRFYNNAVVFLTGGSGFLGKQLIEKLFRSCNISKIYLLLRAKKGHNVQERLNSLVKETVFDTLRKDKPDFTSKIVAVEGDVAEIKLGLMDEDWRTLTEEVDVIFHVAATTKFDETLKLATLINIRGTREVLRLGRSCKILRTYVHVSTAYTHATTNLVGKEVQEEFYETTVVPDTIITMAETMDEDILSSITTDLIRGWPNTYTFTKAIAEELVRKMSSGLPICIVRPGVVLCSYNEPSPGWIDVSSVYGATGVRIVRRGERPPCRLEIVFGVGLGLVHTMHCKNDLIFGVIPCDYVNNAIIAAGRETASNQAKGGNDTRIYTVSTTRRNPLVWKKMPQILKNYSCKMASPAAVYYSYGYETSNKWLYMLLSLFLHIIPAYIADFICLILGQKRRYVNAAKKLYRMCDKLSYYTNNEWIFIDDNLKKLHSNLSDNDRVIFNFDVPNIDWTDYIIAWCIGTRKYIVKDGLKDTKYAVRKQQWLQVAHYILMILYVYGIWKAVVLAFYIVTGVSSILINLLS